MPDRNARAFDTLAIFAGLGENALALTGRVDKVEHQIPFRDKTTEGSVELSWGQRFDW